MFIERAVQASRENSRTEFPEDSLLGSADLSLSKIPGMFYFAGLLLICFSLYLVYSVSGSQNSIQGFNQGSWWQYLIAILPLVFGMSFIMVNKIEKVEFHRKSNLVIYRQYVMFSCFANEERRRWSGLTSAILLKKGIQLKSFNNSCYTIQLTFENEDNLEMLRSHSLINIRSQLQRIHRLITTSDISLKVKVREMID